MHVCQRWRRIILSSPRRLDLHLSCSYGTPVRKNLVFWPVGLPLTVDYPGRLHPDYGLNLAPDDEYDIAFALEHSSRVHRINIHATISLLITVSTTIQKSFPALTHLDLSWNRSQDFSGPFPVVPGRFLNGSAPRLQYLRLIYVSFPQLPTLLLSARNLVTLRLKEISKTGYISPEAMVRSLAMLTRLTTFSISFRGDTSPPDQQTCHDPPARAILPALTDFHYRGRSAYLEDFLAQIDAPQLNRVWIEYFMQQTQLDVHQFSQFISRTENLKIDNFRRAEVAFCSEVIYFDLGGPQKGCHQAIFSLKIIDKERLDTQVPCVAHVLSQLVATFSKVDHLTADGDHVFSREMDITQGLPFFHLFTAV